MGRVHAGTYTSHACYTSFNMSANTNGHFTQGELEFVSFWVRNRLLLRRLGYGGLIGLGIILWGYVLWGMLDAYAISYPRESRFAREIALNQQRLVSLEADRPQNVSLSDVLVFSTTDGRYDFSVEITNPDERWWAEFTYRFSVSGEQTPVRRGYVLPQSTQILTELGYKLQTKGGANASLTIENVQWHRVDPRLVSEKYQDFVAKRFAVTAEDITYNTDIVIGNKPVGQTAFTLVNRSAFGFWSVELILRAYRGQSQIGIAALTVTNLSPGERRPIKFVWFDNLPSVTKTEIIPQVNLLDQSVYLPTRYFK